MQQGFAEGSIDNFVYIHVAVIERWLGGPERYLISKVQEEIRDYCLNRRASLLSALGSQGWASVTVSPNGPIWSLHGRHSSCFQTTACQMLWYQRMNPNSGYGISQILRLSPRAIITSDRMTFQRDCKNKNKNKTLFFGYCLLLRAIPVALGLWFGELW